ncbi:hypothetical protein LIA77_00277 [Sarocladium implicatum]|nr:hypothetical protein LIA77_00277 [Sarocladium implicatum]
MYIPVQLHQAADSAARSHQHGADKEAPSLLLRHLPSSVVRDVEGPLLSLKRQFSDNASKNADIRTGIIVGVVLGVALLGIIAFLWVYRFSIDRMARRKRRHHGHGHRPRPSSSSKSSKSSKSSDAGAPPPPPGDG